MELPDSVARQHPEAEVQAPPGRLGAWGRWITPVAILAVLFYGGLLFWSDYESTTRAMRRLPLEGLLLALGLSTSNYVIRAIRWDHYLAQLGVKLPLQERWLIFIAGFSMTLTPAKVGEVLKSVLLKEAYDIPLTRTMPIVVAERVTDLAGLVLMLAVGSLAFPRGLPVALMGCAGVAALLVICAMPVAGHTTLAILERLPVVKKAVPTFRRLYDSLLTVSKPTTLLYATVLSFLAWMAHGWALFVVAAAFAPPDLSFLAAAFAYAMPLLAGTLAMLPGGLGVAEASMVGLLSNMAGLDTTSATAITILIRVLTFWWAVVLGFSALGLWRMRRAAARGA